MRKEFKSTGSLQETKIFLGKHLYTSLVAKTSFFGLSEFPFLAIALAAHKNQFPDGLPNAQTSACLPGKAGGTHAVAS